MRMFSCGYEREELFRQREQPLQRPLNKKCLECMEVSSVAAVEGAQ